MQPSNQNQTSRHKEKNRQSTCLFADIVAKLVLKHYRYHISDTLLEEFDRENTVVAAFLLLDIDLNDKDPKKLQLLSLGVGTKYLKNYDRGDKSIIKDCHAEILAQKGLKLWMLRNSSLFFATNSVTRKLKLKSNLRLIFYSSSAPCGNSVIKRWVKGVKEKNLAEYDEKPFEYPVMEHESILLQSIQEGQISPMIKPDKDTQIKIKNAKKNPNALNSSTAYIAKDETISDFKQAIKSCSYKISKWNLFGIQGKKLLPFFDPLYIQVMIIGRKFSRPHLRRSLCCRLQDWSYQLKSYSRYKQADQEALSICQQFHVNHPTFLCTGVKLDAGSIQQTSVAQFSSSTCVALVYLDITPVTILIDGSTGKQFGSSDGQRIDSVFLESISCQKFCKSVIAVDKIDQIFFRLKMFKFLAPYRKTVLSKS